MSEVLTCSAVMPRRPCANYPMSKMVMKQALIDLAFTWTQAAMASDRIFGSQLLPCR